MVVTTVTNMKGGVGKSTLSMLLAKFIARTNPEIPVVVIDMDPQAGSTVLLNGTKKLESYTMTDILQAVYDNMYPNDIIYQSFINITEVSPNLYLIPSNQSLVQFVSNGAPTILLGEAIRSIKEVIRQISEKAYIVIDTGNYGQLVTMGIEAADVVLIPMTLSQQTLKPSSITITLALRSGKKLVGVVPSSIGDAKWEKISIESVSKQIKSLPIAKNTDCKFYSGIPYSRYLIRGDWLRSGNIILPDKYCGLAEELLSDIDSIDVLSGV